MSQLNIDTQAKAQVAAALALDKKAEGLKILQVSERTSYTDYLILCSAPSERQAQAIARNVIDGLRSAGIRPLGQEGLNQGHWILLDYGEMVVHIFLEGARSYYDLDGFWGDVEEENLDEEKSLGLLRKIIDERAAENSQAAL